MTKKIDAGRLLLVDVLNRRASRIVYISDTMGNKVAVLLRDIPSLIAELQNVYEEAQENEKA